MISREDHKFLDQPENVGKQNKTNPGLSRTPTMPNTELITCSRIYIDGLFVSNFCTSEKALERDKFMSPEEAKEFGLIDRVLSHPPRTDNSLPTDDTAESS